MKSWERLPLPDVFTVQEISLVRRQQKFLRATKPFSLSPLNTLIIFSCLHSSPERHRTFSELCEVCNVSERTVRQRLRDLNLQGYVSLEKYDHDQRKLKIKLTDKSLKACRGFLDLK